MGVVKVVRFEHPPVSLDFPITAPFGHNTGVHKDHPHKGTDYGCPDDTPVESVCDGIVSKVGRDTDPDDPEHPELGGSKLGNRVWVWFEAPNYSGRVLYAHLGRITVKQGQKIKMGDLIGFSGHSGYRINDKGQKVALGAHLHLEARVFPGDVATKTEIV